MAREARGVVNLAQSSRVALRMCRRGSRRRQARRHVSRKGRMFRRAGQMPGSSLLRCSPKSACPEGGRARQEGGL